MTIRQEIAMALKCQLPVPDFRIIGTIMDEQARELLQTPGWEQREDVIFYSPENSVTQIHYFDGTQLKCPFIAIVDPYLFAGKQGGKLECNLVTMFPGELKGGMPEKALISELQGLNYKGFMAITYSIMAEGLYYNRINLGVPEDFQQNILNLYNLSADWFLADLVSDSLPKAEGISVSARLYTNPYSPVNNLIILDSTPVPGAYSLSECYAVSYWQEKFHIKNAWKELYRLINDPVYAHNGICYNTDGDWKARRVYDYLKKKHILK